MRDIERIDVIIEWLRGQWKQYPDQRLGQLIANHSPHKVRAQSGLLFQLEDDYWVNLTKENHED